MEGYDISNKKKCKICGKTYPENKDYFRLYNYKYREEYCGICLKCEEKNPNRNQKIRKKREDMVKYDLSAADWEECLDYFNHKDAYTGMPLIDLTMDHIIPVSQYGDTIKQNIIPCNLEINSSKSNKHMTTWFKSQDFYSRKRLEKILDWMGSYAKYLYTPIKQKDYTDVNKSKTIFKYNIALPNGENKKMYCSNNNNNKKRTIIVKKAILDKWKDPFDKYWLCLDEDNSHDMYYENQIKNTLNDCVGFILAKDKNSKYEFLNNDDMNKILKNEVILSNMPDNLQDSIYSINNDIEDDMDYKLVTYSNSKKNRKRRVQNWEESNTYKLNKIQKGLINPNNPYIAEWCIVDTENIFNFQGNKYKIDKSVEQYNARTKKPRYDDYKNDYKMDKVLVYEQDGKMYFFDQNIDCINNDLIKLILS